MVAELGPHYLKFALGVLRSALPPRGYMGHVQGYTAHAVLQAVMRVQIQTSVPVSDLTEAVCPASSLEGVAADTRMPEVSWEPELAVRRFRVDASLACMFVPRKQKPLG